MYGRQVNVCTGSHPPTHAALSHWLRHRVWALWEVCARVGRLCSDCVRVQHVAAGAGRPTSRTTTSSPAPVRAPARAATAAARRPTSLLPPPRRFPALALLPPPPPRRTRPRQTLWLTLCQRPRSAPPPPTRASSGTRPAQQGAAPAPPPPLVAQTWSRLLTQTLQLERRRPLRAPARSARTPPMRSGERACVRCSWRHLHLMRRV